MLTHHRTGTSGSAGGIGQEDMAPSLPPQLAHWWVGTSRQHRTDAARRAIHALDAQRVLIFMNFQSRLRVGLACPAPWLPRQAVWFLECDVL